MLSEDHVVVQVNDIHNVFWIIFFEELEDFQLNACLVIVFFLVLDDFNGYIYALFMVEAL